MTENYLANFVQSVGKFCRHALTCVQVDACAYVCAYGIHVDCPRGFHVSMLNMLYWQVFSSLEDVKTPMKDGTLVISGDGRYFNRDAVQIIAKVRRRAYEKEGDQEKDNGYCISFTAERMLVCWRSADTQMLNVEG